MVHSPIHRCPCILILGVVKVVSSWILPRNDKRIPMLLKEREIILDWRLGLLWPSLRRGVLKGVVFQVNLILLVVMPMWILVAFSQNMEVLGILIWSLSNTQTLTSRWVHIFELWKKQSRNCMANFSHDTADLLWIIDLHWSKYCHGYLISLGDDVDKVPYAIA